jgi:hypothetical protein
MTDTTHQPSPQPSLDDLQAEADFRAAIEIVRLIANLETAGPDRRRRIEPHVVWVIARNAGYHNLSGDFLHLVRDGLAKGRALRKRDDAIEPDAKRTLKQTSSVAGHA